MACEMHLFLILFPLLMVSKSMQLSVPGEPQVPCYFIFGDSSADNGNNNLLPTQAKVNFLPYGIDFPDGPTGRFTNGRTAFDKIAELLGFNSSIPPFATALGKDILQGVNYASGSAGIRDESGIQQGAHISMNLQLINHEIIVRRIIGIVGDKDAAEKYLNKCLYSISMGSNDYINNYFMPQFYSTSRLYTTQQYASLLINQYSQQLQKLHSLGARKFALFGLGSIGCTPNAINTYGTNGSICVDQMNDAAALFNEKLVLLVDKLNNNLTDAKFIYVNGTSVTFTGTSVTFTGFTNLNAACCPTGRTGTCVPNGTPICQNRSEYLFWDSFHLTEAAYIIMAQRSYTAMLPTDAYPMDISRLVQLQ